MRTAHYIASTHWDREWYESFQGFRYRLVKLLDEVFDHLESDSAYESFEMDGQAVPVVDYLGIRATSGARINHLSKSGRFRIGPWFVLPDEWLVSGESLIRNLEVGLELTEHFGSPRPTAAPLIDQFGHVSQMPQILSQFGFVGTSLHRGINLKDCAANFIWKAPDGSAIVAHRFGRQGYGSLQIGYRRVLESEEAFDFDEAVRRFVDWTLEEARRVVKGPILLLDSCDHVEIEPKTTAILAAARGRLEQAGIRIKHSNSDEYFEELVKHSVPSRDTEIIGELRESARDRAEVDTSWLISGVLSSRVHLKQANARCEAELSMWAEPFGCFAMDSLGLEYPEEFLNLAWRTLLQNHAHDSICGCSIDQVHKDMEYRFDQSLGISRKLTDTSLHAIAQASVPDGLSKNAMIVVLFNPTSENIVAPTDVKIGFPASWPEKFQEFFGYEEKMAFRLTNNEGREVPWQLNGQKGNQKGFWRPYRKIPVDDTRHVVDVTVTTSIPAFGYTTLVVEPVPGPTRYLGTQRTGERTMENELLRVCVEDDGTVTLLDKTSGKEYRGLFSYEDSADIGDGWNWNAPVNDIIKTSAGSNWTLSVVADGPERTTLEITTRLQVAESFDFKEMIRSNRQKGLTIVNRLTLRRGVRVLESVLKVENTIEDHRLRVLFPTHLRSQSYWADTVFDAAERSIELSADNAMRRELDVDGRPQQSWTALRDGTDGLAVISPGIYESGVKDRPDRPIFLTLLRCFRKAVLSNDNPGGQSLGLHEFRINVVPFSGDVPLSDLFRQGQRLCSSVRSRCLLPREIVMRAKPQLSPDQSFLHIQGNVVVTSVRAGKDNCWNVRIFNPSKELVNFEIGKVGQFTKALAENLSKDVEFRLQLDIKNGVAFGRLGGKRIATIRLYLAVRSIPLSGEEGLKAVDAPDRSGSNNNT